MERTGIFDYETAIQEQFRMYAVFRKEAYAWGMETQDYLKSGKRGGELPFLSPGKAEELATGKFTKADRPWSLADVYVEAWETFTSVEKRWLGRKFRQYVELLENIEYAGNDGRVHRYRLT